MNGIGIKQLKDPVVLIAVGFGSGLAPKAPGTAGTLVAIPLYLLMQPLPLVTYLLITTCLFIAGIWICTYAAEKFGVHIDGPEKTAENLEWCDIALVTGTTIVNNTIDQFRISKPAIFFGVTITGAAYLLGLNTFCYYGH